MRAARSELYADIGTFVIENYRNRGFSTASASIVAKRVQESSQTPIWSTGGEQFRFAKGRTKDRIHGGCTTYLRDPRKELEDCELEVLILESSNLSTFQTRS
jgi:hypothetical protein